MTEERRSRSYARRRDLRATPPATAAPPGDGWPGPRQAGPDADVAAGPTTQELALYRPDPVLPARRNDLELPPASPDGDRGERTRAFVERWSLWASGLGKPPREPSGGRRYPAGDSMLVPGLVVAAGLGVAVLIGLLTGVLVSAPGRDAAAAGQLTVTVTQPVTPPAITETETRTRTRTTTVTATPTAEPPQNSDGTVLQPGSQGPEVAQLQQDLAALGFFRRAPDGTYDEETRAAVQAFQAQYQVAGDPPGVAGPGTREALAEAVGRT